MTGQRGPTLRASFEGTMHGHRMLLRVAYRLGASGEGVRSYERQDSGDGI